MSHLIIFADYGLDDAAATVSILTRAERFDYIDIVPIGGNVPVAVAYRNAFTLLAKFPEALNKIRVVDTRHISQPSEYLADIHGADGMGDLFDPAVPDGPVVILTFEDWVSQLSGQEVILSLGPMTLVRPLMERQEHPLVIMGGCIDTPPNFHGFEFNHCLDKEAFSFCAPQAQAVITLDTCRVSTLDLSGVEVTGRGLHAQIMRAAQTMSTAWDDAGCHMWDDVAACYVLFPDRFQTTLQTDPHGNTYAHAMYCSQTVYYEDQ